jgi:chemotaxis protein MotB
MAEGRARRPSVRQPEAPPIPFAKPRQRVRKHRGGAWKVAYADFVTALMALFIVLWMMNSSAVVREAVSGYFKDPKAFAKTRGSGPANAGEGLPITRDNARDLQKQIEEALRRAPDFQKMKDHIQISVTGEGLRIDLLETEQGMFFVSGSPNPTPSGERLIQTLAQELGRMQNEVVIEGHTDSRPFKNSGPTSGYSNWELSSDRANAARRLLHSFGVAPNQVVEVRGFADRKLMEPAAPDDARNRRISLVVKM